MEPGQEIINYLKKLEEKARMADRNRSLAGEASRQFVPRLPVGRRRVQGKRAQARLLHQHAR